MANPFPQPPPTSSLHSTRLHCIFQTPHRDSFSTAARNPFLLASLAADTSSPLPGSFAPSNLFKRARHSTSSNTFFTLSLPFLRSFFLHILSFSPKTPHGRTQTRPHHAGSSASQTMPQPTPNRNPCHALHSPVSLPTGPWLSSPPLRFSRFSGFLKGFLSSVLFA